MKFPHFVVIVTAAVAAILVIVWFFLARPESCVAEKMKQYKTDEIVAKIVCDKEKQSQAAE